MDWISLTWNRGEWRVLLDTEMNLQVLYNSGKFLSKSATRGLSSMELVRKYRINSVYLNGAHSNKQAQLS
jgi:hypothetical protein